MDSTLLTGLLVYVGLTLAIGVYAGTRVKDSSDFLVAGRRLGLVLSTGTLAATWFGGGIVVGASSQAYKHGFLGVIADPFGAALCLIVAGLFYVRTLRRMGLTTIASFFEARFGRNAGLLAAVCTIPTYIGWVASLMVAFGRVVQVVAGVDPDIGIWIGAAIVLFYCVCFWKIFSKAGQPGWAAFIPIYNTVVLLQIVGRPVWWVVLSSYKRLLHYPGRKELF